MIPDPGSRSGFFSIPDPESGSRSWGQKSLYMYLLSVSSHSFFQRFSLYLRLKLVSMVSPPPIILCIVTFEPGGIYPDQSCIISPGISYNHSNNSACFLATSSRTVVELVNNIGGEEPSRNRVVVPARQATQTGAIGSLQSILGLHKRFKIRAQESATIIVIIPPAS
jgi:hypothetical protein